MKKNVLFLLFVSVSFLLTGCDSTIDASSAESMEKSVTNVMNSLPPERAPIFKDALVQLSTQATMRAFKSATSNMKAGMEDPMAWVSQQASNQAKIEAELVNLIDGKTGEEIITLAVQAKKEIAEAEKLRAIEEIATLSTSIERWDAEMAKLDGMGTKGYELYVTDKFFGHRGVKLTVTNTLDKPLAKITIGDLYEYADNGQTFVYDEASTYLKDNPLKPTETRTVTFSFGAFSKFSSRTNKTFPEGLTHNFRIISIESDRGSVLPQESFVAIKQAREKVASLKEKHNI